MSDLTNSIGNRDPSFSDVNIAEGEETLEEIYLSDVYSAKQILEDKIHHTPLDPNHSISEDIGCNIYFKLENMQKSGSHKVRGIMTKFHSLTAAEKKRGVVAASNGNHGLAVAYTGKFMNIPTTIIVPNFTNPRRSETMKKYGATVISYGNTVEEAEEFAKKMSQEKRFTFIESSDDITLIAGNGTIGLEILKDLSEVDAIVCPIGSGSLISGIGLAVKTLDPRVKIYGVQNIKGQSAYLSKKHHKICKTHQDEENELTDVVNKIGTLSLHLMEKYVDDIFTVDETQITRAMMLMMERCKIICEGTGALALAGLMSNVIPIEKGKNVVLIVSDGNVNMKLLNNVIDLGLINCERSLTLEVLSPEGPAYLNDIISIIAEQKAQMYSFNVKKNVGIGMCNIRFNVEVADKLHKQRLSEALKSKGYQFNYV